GVALPGEPGGDEPRVEGIGADARALEAAGQLEREVEVHELGGRVDVHAPVAATLELEVVEVEALAGARGRSRREHDDAGRGGGPEAVEQQRRQQEVPEVVDLELCLEAVVG